MFVDDFADAVIYFMNKKISQPYINIGTGKDYTIEWYANFLMKKMNVKLKIKYDRSKPDGMPKKCLDISLAKKYGYKVGDFPIAENLSKTIISLPVHEFITKKDIKFISEKIKDFYSK